MASLLFYAYGEPVFVLLLAGLALLDYFFGRLLEKYRSRWILALAVGVNLLTLIWFKYIGLLAEAVSAFAGIEIPAPAVQLPIGISFFTFQAMSCVIDVYRGRTEAERHYFTYLLYLSFFPQLIAGPIVKYQDVRENLASRRVTPEGTAAGLRRFSVGLCKKVLLANQLGKMADTVFSLEISRLNGISAWLGAVSWMLQIYFDFSGYSDMAIGLGRMFGFSFPENFRYPYCAGSLREFWRRWHMSLTSWFRDYLYIPLGGNRRGSVRTACNRLIVFLCTGLWHGANVTFLFWGLYHGVLTALESLTEALWGQNRKLRRLIDSRVGRGLSHLYTLLAVCVGFVFFRADTLKQGFLVVRAMFIGWRFEMADFLPVLGEQTPLFLFVLAISMAAALPVWHRLLQKKDLERLSWILSIPGLLLCILQLAGSTYNPFIYFQF